MKRRLLHVVQPFEAVGSQLVPGPARDYPTAVEAERAGAALSGKAPGVLVYMIEGDPEAGCWDEPEILATYGFVPERAA